MVLQPVQEDEDQQSGLREGHLHLSESSSEDDRRPPLTQDKMMMVSIGRVCRWVGVCGRGWRLEGLGMRQ